MGAIATKLDGSGHLYLFSDDILDAIAALSKLDAVEFGVRNSSAVFLGGSYLEAFINEQIAIHAAIAPERCREEAELWKTLESQQTDLKVLQKWDLITAFTKGRKWNSGEPPFQDFDTLISLRNELVHFKGRWSETGDPPIKRIKSLLTRFGMAPTIFEEAMGVSAWVSALLRSPQLLEWIHQTVFALEEPIEEFLLGRVPEGDMIRLKHSRRLQWGLKTMRYALP